MRLLSTVLITLLVSCVLFGQTYTVSTFAGGALTADIPGLSASLPSPSGIAVDAAGNVFFTSGNTVFRLDVRSGILNPIAGNGTPGFSGDNGPAPSAQLNGPRGVALDSTGNLYIADTGNNRVRRVSHGVIATVAGSGRTGLQLGGFGGDNSPAISAQLNGPGGIAVNSAGDLFIADSLNSRIRKVSNAVITTVAVVTDPEGVVLDSVGNLYIVNSLYDQILKLTNGVLTTFAGIGSTLVDNGPFPYQVRQLDNPSGVAVDSADNLYISDSVNQRIRRVSRGVITTVAGTGAAGFSGDNGPAISAQLYFPRGIAVDSAGNLFIADSLNNRVRKVSNGTIDTVVGGGAVVVGFTGFRGDNGPATSAQLNYPAGVAVDCANDVYIADYYNNRVRKVSQGTITTIAGNGTQGRGGDNGPAINAQLITPDGVAVDPSGNIYIAELGGSRIRKVSNGVIATVAGGGSSLGDNGPPTSAQLSQPVAVAVDLAGSLYIADRGTNRIRKVSNGVITTVAGNGTLGFSGDGGPAIGAQLAFPTGVAVDAGGDVFIADAGNNRIRKVSGGIITTVVGTGAGGFGGDDGPATNAQLVGPTGVALDSAGGIYIADASNNRLRKVSNGIITTIAGNGAQSFGGDNGPATIAQLDEPLSVAVDSLGNVYFTDSTNSRVRVLTPSGPSKQSPSITAVANGASNLSGPIAPGEIVALYGSAIGPVELISASVGSDGLYDAQLAGTTVQFNGIPAPMIYTSTTQAAAIVPYEVTGANAQVTVTYLGQTSAPMTVAVASAAPGIFSLDSTGKGQAAAVNQGGAINGTAAPAKRGDIILLFATGEGQTMPAGVDGKPTALPLPQPTLPLTVNIGGQSVQPQYAGGAPGEVAGLLQINVQIPASVAPGSSVPVAVEVGGAASQTGVTIAVGP